ncbi:MAG: hypothetical protein QXP78_02715 [Candidatus Bathyarchaeia archaeon]
MYSVFSKREALNNKRALLSQIIGFVAFLGILAIILLWFYLYNSFSSSGGIDFDAKIDSLKITRDGSYAIVKLKGGAYSDKKIESIEFVFKTNDDKIYSYKTKEGIENFETPGKRSFFRNLFGTFEGGVYEFEIPLDSVLGLSSFRDVREVSVVFNYKEGEEEKKTRILDIKVLEPSTNKTEGRTNQSQGGNRLPTGGGSPSGGGSSTGSGSSPGGGCFVTNTRHRLGCYQNSVYWFDNCGSRRDLNKTCEEGEVCEDGECVAGMIIPNECEIEGMAFCIQDYVYNCTRSALRNLVKQLLQDCALDDKICQNGACVPRCIPTNFTYRLGCHNGNVYWFDDCGNLREIKQQCVLGTYCSNGVCLVSNCSNGIQDLNEEGIDCGGPCEWDCPANYKSGISVFFNGTPGIDYSEEYFWYNKVSDDSKVVYIKSNTPIIMKHNERNMRQTAQPSPRFVYNIGDEGIIRYKFFK